MKINILTPDMPNLRMLSKIIVLSVALSLCASCAPGGQPQIQISISESDPRAFEISHVGGSYPIRITVVNSDGRMILDDEIDIGSKAEIRFSKGVCIDDFETIRKSNNNTTKNGTLQVEWQEELKGDKRGLQNMQK